ncbi:hypothetical protein KXV95_008438 [Aspergillus fumigatus]|nr:hypothetical protein KXX07_003314 [Aspergillus fumigatus]KAH2648315.1 hypothetical protein KXV79_001287 [Aspergillus fumigatus]KAH3586432.1 hypothetical protein KXV95_008438 [Aspergillus fumigatus]
MATRFDAISTTNMMAFLNHTMVGCPRHVDAAVSASPTSAETNYQLVRLCPSLEADETAQVKQYVHLYFARFHPHWPILHRATFSIPNEPPLLLQTVLMIGLWVSGKTSARNAAVDLHSKLGLSIHEQR